MSLQSRTLTSTCRAASSADREVPRLRGELGVWLIILTEMLTFGILFVAFAYVRMGDVALFNASQAMLNLHSGALNTALLISGSACVAGAVAAMRRDARRRCLHLLLSAMACGVGFVVVKLWEYSGTLAQGVDASGNAFYLFYLFLTGFHFLHVLIALGALAYLAWRVQRGAYASSDCEALETGAAFWHMVDLLWLVLFPLVYVIH